MGRHRSYREWITSLLTLTMFMLLPVDTAAAVREGNSENIDWVDIAYGKARIISGHAGPEETLALMNRLVDLGHLETAQTLLQKSPPLPAAYMTQRTDLELRLSQAQYFRHQGNQDAQQADQRKIEKLLLQLTRTKQLATPDVVRYQEMAEQFGVGEAVVAFCERLARLAPPKSSRWWFKAGQWRLAEKMTQEALLYYDRAIASAQSSEEFQVAFISKLNVQWTAGQCRQVTTEIEAAIAAAEDVEYLDHLARFTLGIERPDLAWRLYARLTTIAPDRTDHWLKETVRWAVAAEQPLQAAGFLEKQLPEISSPDLRNEVFYSRFTLLRHGNQLDQAMPLAEKLIEYMPEDAILLEQSVQLALESKNIKQADQWNRLLMEMNPGDKDVLKRQAEISIAAQEPQKAVEIVRQLNRSAPRDEKILHQLGQLEEWAGNPGTALSYLQRMSRTQNRLELHEQVYRLSRMLNEHQTALDALKRISASRRLSKGELTERIYLLERIGEPEKAAAQTMAYLNQNPEDYLVWLELAHLQMRNWQYRQAITTWEQIAARFGRHSEETLYRSECYWRIGAKKDALEVIDSFEGRLVSPDNPDHADLLVELSWRYRRFDLARSSLESLLKHYDETQFHTLERLIYLEYENENLEEAIRIALRSAQETRDRRFLLLALRLADADFDQQQVELLLQKIKMFSGRLDSEPLYWIIQARLKYARMDYANALKFYRKASALDGKSISVKEGILWCLASVGDRENLPKQLNDWRQEALEHRELWLVYAVSHQSLGQYRQSGIWYERLIRNGGRDYGIILGYADVLEFLGAKDRAFRLRLWAMRNLRSKAADFLAAPGRLTDSIKSYVALMHRYGHARQGEYWFQTLQQLEQGRAPDPWLHELAISWHLNSQRPDQAKIWLAKAHKQRIQTPKWQEIFIALEESDRDQLTALLENGSRIDPGTEAQILEKLDRRREALQVAETAIDLSQKKAQRDAAGWQAAALKQEFPANLRSGIDITFSDQLERREFHFGSRYSFRDTPIGLDLNLRRMDYHSSIYLLEDHDSADDLAITTHFGDGRWGGSAAIGFNGFESDNIGYARLECRQRFAPQAEARLKLSYHDVPQVDSILQIATLQNRLDAGLSGVVNKNYYYYLNFWGREYISRDNHLVAQGGGGTTEIGFTQHWGRFQWSAGVLGNGEVNFNRWLPDDLKVWLPVNYTIDSVVAPKATTLLVGGRISRGNIRETYPITGSLRWFASAWVGKTWPQDKPTANLRTGSGIRIFGHDELSLELYYNQSGGVVGRNDDAGMSMQYRYYF